MTAEKLTEMGYNPEAVKLILEIIAEGSGKHDR